MGRPIVNTRAFASHYSGPDERIIEVSNGVRSADGHRGALIAFRGMPDGTFRIEIYRADPGVDVHVNQTEGVTVTVAGPIVRGN